MIVLQLYLDFISWNCDFISHGHVFKSNNVTLYCYSEVVTLCFVWLLIQCTVLSCPWFVCVCVFLFQRPRHAHALFDFTSNHATHLRFLRGDVIDLLDCSDAQCWRGRCRGRVGVFPPEYVQPMYHWISAMPMRVTILYS